MAAFYYPRSFLRLLLGGFVLIALPLMFALVNNAISIDRLANRSQKAVYQAVLATQNSRRLSELLTAMERSAHQMTILGERTLLDTYLVNRAEFLTIARDFSELPFDSRQMDALEDILQGEALIYAVLSDPQATPPQVKEVLRGFDRLAEQAYAITERSNQLIDREVGAMRSTARSAQRITLWQLLGLVPVVVLLVIGFTILLARPVREIDHAIRRLGSGDFKAPVTVSGPQDLQYLGERLDWMRRRLLELEEQKNRFLREVSHELKTPLSAVREGAELMSEEAVGGLTPEQREVAEIVRHNSMELQKLIEDLLAFGASHFHKTPLELNTFDVRRVVRRVLDDQKLALMGRRLTTEVHAADFQVTADFEKLRVILDNLVSNAIKFSPAGGVIRIDAVRQTAAMELVVRDQGPGIPADERKRVFEPFYRGHNAMNALVKGTGVGLSVVDEYARLHGGSVEIRDDPVSPGAVIAVRLPLQPALERVMVTRAGMLEGAA